MNFWRASSFARVLATLLLIALVVAWTSFTWSLGMNILFALLTLGMLSPVLDGTLSEAEQSLREHNVGPSGPDANQPPARRDDAEKEQR